jgi:hypothetical protein
VVHVVCSGEIRSALKILVIKLKGTGHVEGLGINGRII